MEGGRKKSQGLKWKEGKGNESTLHSKCLVYKGERKGKKKFWCSSIDSLFSLFPSNLGGKENVDPMENSAFSFPSFHFSLNK